MTAVVPLLAEALNLAITEHWTELGMLEIKFGYAARCRQQGYPQSAAAHDDRYTAGVEALAVALHARLQEQGALT